MTEAVRFLTEFLADRESRGLRAIAIRAIVRIGPAAYPALPVLSSFLHGRRSPISREREHARIAIAQISSKLTWLGDPELHFGALFYWLRESSKIQFPEYLAQQLATLRPDFRVSETEAEALDLAEVTFKRMAAVEHNQRHKIWAGWLRHVEQHALLRKFYVYDFPPEGS